MGEKVTFCVHRASGVVLVPPPPKKTLPIVAGVYFSKKAPS